MTGKLETAIPAIAAIVLIAGSVAIFAPSMGSAATVQASGLSVDGDTATVDDSITAIDVTVNGNVEWSDLPAEAESVTIKTGFADNNARQQTQPLADTQTIDASGTDGSTTFEVSGNLIRGETDWTADHFVPANPGETRSRTMYLVIGIHVSWDGGEKSTVIEDTFTITVERPEDESANPSVVVTASGTTTIRE